MAFFDNLGKKVSQVAQSAVEKSKDLAETAKLNMAISSEEREIEKAYKQLGEWYFNAFGENCDLQMAETVNEIKASFAKIQQFKAELEAETPQDGEENKAAKNCPVCGEKADEDSKFCPACGSQMNK